MSNSALLCQEHTRLNNLVNKMNEISPTKEIAFIINKDTFEVHNF